LIDDDENQDERRSNDEGLDAGDENGAMGER